MFNAAKNSVRWFLSFVAGYQAEPEILSGIVHEIDMGKYDHVFDADYSETFSGPEGIA